MTDERRFAIKALRASSRLTMRQIAREFGVSVNTVWRVISGQDRHDRNCSSWCDEFPQHRVKPPKPRNLSHLKPNIAQSDFLKPISLARLMAGR